MLSPAGAPVEASGLSLISIGRGVLVDAVGSCSLTAGLLFPIEELDTTRRSLPGFAGFLTGVVCDFLAVLLEFWRSAAGCQSYFNILQNLHSGDVHFRKIKVQEENIPACLASFSASQSARARSVRFSLGSQVGVYFSPVRSLSSQSIRYSVFLRKVRWSRTVRTW